MGACPTSAIHARRVVKFDRNFVLSRVEDYIICLWEYKKEQYLERVGCEYIYNHLRGETVQIWLNRIPRCEPSLDHPLRNSQVDNILRGKIKEPKHKLILLSKNQSTPLIEIVSWAKRHHGVLLGVSLTRPRQRKASEAKRRLRVGLS